VRARDVAAEARNVLVIDDEAAVRSVWLRAQRGRSCAALAFDLESLTRALATRPAHRSGGCSTLDASLPVKVALGRDSQARTAGTILFFTGQDVPPSDRGSVDGDLYIALA